MDKTENEYPKKVVTKVLCRCSSNCYDKKWLNYNKNMQMFDNVLSPTKNVTS